MESIKVYFQINNSMVLIGMNCIEFDKFISLNGYNLTYLKL